MADFFDKLKDKLDEGISTLSAKSKGAIELSRLRNQLRTLEKDKDDRLRDLGRMVYDMVRLDKYQPQEVSEFCRKIGDIDRQIVLVEEEIKRAQALSSQSGQESFIATCDCGAGLSANQKFCGVCGREVSGLTVQPEHSPDKSRLCSSCGSEIKTEAKFCGKCGAHQ
jgi:hypothetical protein